MRAFGYIASRYDSGMIVKILSEDGIILTAIEVRNYTKAPEIAQKFCPRGYEFEWSKNPWSDPGFKHAVKEYEDRYSCDFAGKCQ